MPFVGLVITSIGFLVPGILAWRRHLWGEAVSGILVSTSSIFYHGTLHPLAKGVDMAIAHTLGIRSIGRACINVVRRSRPPGIPQSRWKPIGILGGTLGSIAIYWFKSKTNPHPYSKYWHMVFHLTSQATWVVHLWTQ
jgi:hypothetical protein